MTQKDQGIRHMPRFLGFDAFIGMPVESEEPSKQIDTPGSYNLLDHYKVHTLTEAIPLLIEDIKTNLQPGTRLEILPGLVQDTLTDSLVEERKLQPAYYVDFDMDIYTPTKLTLDWMFRNKLIVEGTIIGYDDWNQNYPQSPIYTCGESRAHKEMCEKHHATCLQLFETEEHGQTAFLVTKIDE
jgi:hypothetical protein